MKKLLFTSACLLLIFLAVFSSCSDDEGNEILISKVGLLKSHNGGDDCMNCHKSGGSGEGIFQTAGTVYDSAGVNMNPNGLVKLYAGANGSGLLIKSVEVDGKGNFYSTESVDFTGNVYPAITGFSGKTVYMQSRATSGKCNSCHDGTTTNRIWVN